MSTDFAEEELMLLDLVEKFVENELMPLERAVLERDAQGEPPYLVPEEEQPLLDMCRELGLWALD
ncbi:MAG: acyl-CoA dehydrogenase, partial [Actinomycetia bacterium]|nr:acyl-CoA dehydrogenase [Actinomycetes bacterium]